MFIDNIGGSLLFPFLTLYVTQRFGVSLIDIGWIHVVSTMVNVVGTSVGGALADKFGRKTIGLIGLFGSALITIPLGLTGNWGVFIIFNLLTSFMGHFASPAFQALIADLLPSEKRSQGYSAMYVIGNLAGAIGPMLGGLLATHSFLLLFIVDCILSVGTGIFLIFKMPETQPQETENTQKQNLRETFAGYGQVMRDRVFVTLVALIVMTMLVYMNYNTTLSVYLNRLHGITAKQFGYLLTLNAGMIVLFQFTVTRLTAKFKRPVMMFIGTLLYAVGFSMVGFGNTYAHFIIAFAIVTLGELISSPLYQSVAAEFAPIDMRGRYMAFLNISYSFAAAAGPLVAGYVMETSHPQWVWYGGGVLCVIAAFGFLKTRENPQDVKRELQAEGVEIL
ncbi:MAG: MFS transporter [Chloroflexi bacterium]|nr:MFS transporter [Chloroflexota bacterium]